MVSYLTVAQNEPDSYSRFDLLADRDRVRIKDPQIRHFYIIT